MSTINSLELAKRSQQLPLDTLLLAGIARSIQIVSILEFKREFWVRMPRAHQPIVGHVIVAIEANVGSISISHCRSPCVVKR
jgi:hypothetical protein